MYITLRRYIAQYPVLCMNPARLGSLAPRQAIQRTRRKKQGLSASTPQRTGPDYVEWTGMHPQTKSLRFSSLLWKPSFLSDRWETLRAFSMPYKICSSWQLFTSIYILRELMQAMPSPPYCNIAAKVTHSSRLCAVVAFWPVSCRPNKYQAHSSHILG